MDKHSYKPPYTWPSPSFPFRLYFSSPTLRIFIIESLRNNWNWLLKYHENIKETDIFFIISGWHHSEATSKDCRRILEMLGLKIRNFFFMAGSDEELRYFKRQELVADLLPHNAWLDSNEIMRPLGLEKIYNAIYVGRRTAFKRHMLASGIEKLAIVAGNNHGNALSQIPETSYLNDTPLSPEEVSKKINLSFCGLILSEVEGGCFASSEYLMCGIPVVSTFSKGGRDFWYNDYNSKVVEADSNEVRKAVHQFVNHPPNPHIVSELHKVQAANVRLRFIRHLERIFCLHGHSSINAYNYFHANFIHKMRQSITPDFPSIFK